MQATKLHSTYTCITSIHILSLHLYILSWPRTESLDSKQCLAWTDIVSSVFFNLSETTLLIHREKNLKKKKYRHHSFKRGKNKILITVQCKRTPSSFCYLFSQLSSDSLLQVHTNINTRTHIWFRREYICKKQPGRCVQDVVLCYLRAFL